MSEAVKLYSRNGDHPWNKSPSQSLRGLPPGATIDLFVITVEPQAPSDHAWFNTRELLEFIEENANDDCLLMEEDWTQDVTDAERETLDWMLRQSVDNWASLVRMPKIYIEIGKGQKETFRVLDGLDQFESVGQVGGAPQDPSSPECRGASE